MSRYTRPDTSDKRDGENWVQYWDRKADEAHGPGCECLHHRLRRMGVGDAVLLGLTAPNTDD